MKATKYTVTLEVEVLSMDAVATQIMDAAKEIGNERQFGELHADDGDSVKWKTKSKKVEF